MKHRITVMILAVMLVFSLLPTFAFATDDIIPGYNDHDVARILAFLDLPNGTGTNAQELNYNKNFPTTWFGVSWDSSTPKRITHVSWGNEELAGDLDLSGCTSLTHLATSNAHLTSVNVSGCSALKYLACGNSEVASLNVSGCTALNTLGCNVNELTAVDVSTCTALKELNFYNNHLTEIDLIHNPLLEELQFAFNPIETLDVSGHSSLKNLYCNDCELKTLNVSGCTALDRFFCHNNQLKSVDISTCTALKTYFCTKNKMETLDLGVITGLTWLDCTENPMTSFRGVFHDKMTNLTADGNGYIGMYYKGPSFVDKYALAVGNGATSFVNWTDEMGTSIGTDAKITLKDYNDYNITAHFSDCVVTFDKNGGDTDADPKSAVVPVGTTVSAPTTNPTRDDYLFDGWYKESACNNAWDFDTDTAPGNTTLYAKWNPVQHVTDVSLNLTAKTLNKNGTVTLTAEVLPADATYPDITWTSSDESVATVDANGKVTAGGAGSATITATADGKKSTCEVTVNPVHVTDVTLNLTAKTLDKSGTVTLTAEVLPADATYPDITWTSSDETVATVDANGKVTAVGAGSATITATADGKKSTCEVTVNPVHVMDVTLNITAKTLDKSGTITLTAEVLPADATYPDITWTSSDETVATVDANGKVTAVGAGSTTITATADGKKSTCEVMVNPVHVMDVTLNLTAKTLDKSGTVTLTAEVLPADATYPDITWTSSDESVVTVDANGKVTAVGAGSATITATADGKTSTCAVTVTDEQTDENTITVMGTLLDDNGNPLAGYTVELHSTPRTAVTDSQGRYAFSDVEIDNHTLTVIDKTGTELKTFAVAVKEGDDFSWNQPTDESITAVVSGDTASIDVTIKIAEDGTVTLGNIEPIVNPKTGVGQSAWVLAAGIALVLAIAGLILIGRTVKQTR